MRKINVNYTFRAIIERDKPKGFHGFVPLLKGLHTFGSTIEETRKNLKEATICHLQGLIKDGQIVPREEESFELIQAISEKELVRA